MISGKYVLAIALMLGYVLACVAAMFYHNQHTWREFDRKAQSAPVWSGK